MCCFGVLPAQAQTLEHARSTNTLRCAAEPRPGFADADEQGRITGLAVDLCRAVAIATLGPTATIQINLPEAENEFALIATGQVDLAFLSDPVIAEHHLAMQPGPVVFTDPIALIVPEASNIRTTADLPGQTICLIVGSDGQMALEATFGHSTPPIIRLSFREDVEMLDAYNVGRCEAAVDDTTRLSEMMQSTGINHLRSRLLGPPLAMTTLRAITPLNDPAWTAAVGRALAAFPLNRPAPKP